MSAIVSPSANSGAIVFSGHSVRVDESTALRAEAAAASAERAVAFGTVYTESDADMASIGIDEGVDIVQRLCSVSGQVAPEGQLSWWARNPTPGTDPYFTTSGGVTWTQTGLRSQDVLAAINSAVDGIGAAGVMNFATRADAVSWLGSNTPGVGFVLEWPEAAVRYTGSGTVIADMPGCVPHGDDDPAIHGAPLTGDARPLIEKAIDSATVNVNIQAQYQTDAQLSPVAGKKIDGRNIGGVTRLATAASGPNYVLAPASDLTIRNMTLNAEPMPSSANGAALLNLGVVAENILIDGITSDFGINVDPSTGARNANAFIALFSNTTNVDGLEIRNSEFSGYFWGLNQSNTNVSAVKNVSIVGNKFDEFGSTYLLFNSPAAGSINENILVAFNDMGAVRSRQPFDSGAPGFPHRGSFAGHVEYSRLIGNHAFGYGGELFRAEEAVKGSVWIANTAKLDGKDGIEIIPNNAGGTVYTPTLFSVSNNVIENTGLVSAPALGWGIGLHTYTSASGLADAECIGESAIHDNISKGWAQALQTHQGTQRNLIHHNVLVDSDDGIKTWNPSLGVQDNLISDCATTIQAERGGAIGRFHIRSAANAIPNPAVIVTSTGPLSATAWTWETGRHSVANGGNFYRLIDVGSLINAEVTVAISDDLGVQKCIETGLLTWDGATMIYTRKARSSSGAVILSTSAPWGVDTSDLAIQVYNGSGGTVSNIRIQVAMNGLHIWGA